MNFKKILDELYLDILHRHIDKEGLSYYSHLLQNNSITINEIKDNLLNSDERKNNPEFHSVVSNYLSELSLDEELMLEKNLIWICGSPRSGTTWLARDLLSCSSNFINEFHLDEHLAVTSVGVFDPKYKRRIDRHKDQPDYFLSDTYSLTWKYYLRKLILNRINSQFNDLTKKIIIKEPGNVGAYDVLSKCLPNSKLIILLRDGRDVIDSLLDALQNDGFITLFSDYTPVSESERLSFIESRAILWVNLVNILLKTIKNHNSDLCLVIKYEDLLHDTKNCLRKIYEFAEITISEIELVKIIDKNSFEKIPKQNKGKGKFYRSASPGKWKENLSNEEIELIEKIMRPALDKLEYI